MADWVIETSGLQKHYRRKVAVADLTLTVPPGEVFGFLGPNGAGKSTAVKMLLGLVRPTGGTVRVLGQRPGHRATMARIGFLPEHFRFHTWMTATELLALHSRLYGMDQATSARRIPELLDEPPLCPVILHFGRHDASIPPDVVDAIADAYPDMPVYRYDAGHGFNSDRADHHPDAARLARLRTLQLFALNGGGRGEL